MKNNPATIKKWRENNKEKLAKDAREYRKKNKEKVNEWHRKWTEENKEKIKLYKQKNREKNIEKIKERERKYYIKNKSKILSVAKKYREDNYDKLRFYKIKNNFGLSKEEYLKIFEKQNNKCAICFMTDETHHQRLGVDHNHTTGKVRGLLCAKCNAGLGYLNDDIQLLKNAVKYMKQYEY